MKFKEAEKAIYDVLKKKKILKTKSVWEKFDGGYKWVLFLHNLLWKDEIITYTKIILKTDDNKEKLLSKEFSYLYDLNCKYRFVSFESGEDLKNKLKNIFNNGKFGNDISNLNAFLGTPVMNINEYFNNQGVQAYTIYTFQYSPKTLSIPCEDLSFTFEFNVNDTEDVELNVMKKKDNNFLLSFLYLQEISKKNINDIKELEEAIGQWVTENISS